MAGYWLEEVGPGMTSLGMSPDNTPWAEYVLRALKAGREHDAASPWSDEMPLIPWMGGDRGETIPYLTQYVWDIAPYLQGDYVKDLPAEDRQLLADWAGGTKYNSLQKDSWSPLGDPFFSALGI